MKKQPLNKRTPGAEASGTVNQEKAQAAPPVGTHDADYLPEEEIEKTEVHIFLGISDERGAEIEKEANVAIKALLKSGKQVHSGSILKAVQPIAQSPLEGLFIGYVTAGVIDQILKPHPLVQILNDLSKGRIPKGDA